MAIDSPARDGQRGRARGAPRRRKRVGWIVASEVTDKVGCAPQMAEPRRKRAPLAIGADRIEQELDRLRVRLRREGAAKLSTLKPPALRDDVARRLVYEGFEIADSFVRRSLAGQLRDAVANEQAIAANAPEGKKNDVGVLASGMEHVLSAATHVLDAPRNSTHQPAAAAKRAPAVELSPDTPPSPARTPVDALAQLLAALDAEHDERTGLSFVPAVVRRLSSAMTVSAAHDALLSAARRELVELRPEGGLARLSAEELAQCPPGPAGTLLSWARRGSGAGA